MNFDVIKNALVSALNAAGVTEYEIYYTSGSDNSIGTLNKEVNTFSSSTNGGLCLRLVRDGKMGYASTELMTEGEMVELARRAIANASATEKPDTVGIYCGGEEYEENRIPAFVPVSTATLRHAAVKTGEAIFARDARVQNGSESQAISSGFDIRIVNSHGLDLVCSCGINAIIGQSVVMDKDEKQEDYCLRAFSEANLDAVIDEIAGEAVGNALAKIGAGLVPSGKYNLIFSGKQMRSLMSVFSSAFSGKAVIDGMSPLKGKLGEVIAAPIVTITDDPQREGNSIGLTFDAEGVPTHRHEVVSGGVLNTFLHNRETAKQMGSATTANASKAGYSSPVGVRPHSFCIEPGDKTNDELLAMAEGGIYITELKGLHAGANPITGDFSLESAGFMIRGGKLAEAVKSFTVAGNFFEMLKSICALGNKLETGLQTGFTGFGSPDVFVPDMSVAGE
ncbi:MAG: TldD/PmbA family protein [Clostridia bacterium]|nr:TldD/PmbA family protein [Clostridia bacterium]